MPSVYKEETFGMVLRWVAGTQVEFVPNGKKAGTKSYDRYEKYSQGKTVSEVLGLGAKPEDLLNDYEKKLLKYSGGPIRDVPLDIMKLENASELTSTDLVLARFSWANNKGGDGESIDKSAVHKKLRQLELAVKHNISLQDVASANWCESIGMIAQRTKAANEASKILESVQAEGRKVTSEDVLHVLRMWRFRENYTRSSVIPEGVKTVKSDMLGLLCSRDGRCMQTKEAEEYPQVVRLLCQWLKDNGPEGLEMDWPFTTITVNSMYAAKLHRDVGNLGPAIIAAFGDFTGGRLLYWPDDDRRVALEGLLDEHATSLDIGKQPAIVDGNRAHKVQAFEGERFSLVFYTADKYAKTPEPVREALTRAGVMWPSEETLAAARALLPAPKGYGAGEDKPREQRPRKSKVATKVATAEPNAATDDDKNQSQKGRQLARCRMGIAKWLEKKKKKTSSGAFAKSSSKPSKADAAQKSKPHPRGEQPQTKAPSSNAGKDEEVAPMKAGELKGTANKTTPTKASPVGVTGADSAKKPVTPGIFMCKSQRVKETQGAVTPMEESSAAETSERSPASEKHTSVTPPKKHARSQEGSSDSPKRVRSTSDAAPDAAPAGRTPPKVGVSNAQAAKRARLEGTAATAAEQGFRLLQGGMQALRDAAKLAPGGQQALAKELRPELMAHLNEALRLAVGH